MYESSVSWEILGPFLNIKFLVLQTGNNGIFVVNNYVL